MRGRFIQALEQLNPEKVVIKVKTKSLTVSDLLAWNDAFRSFMNQNQLKQGTCFACVFSESSQHLPCALSLVENATYVALHRYQEAYCDYWITDDLNHPWIKQAILSKAGVIHLHDKVFKLVKAMDASAPFEHKDDWVTLSESSGTSNHPKRIAFSSEAYANKMFKKQALYHIDALTHSVCAVALNRITTLGECLRVITVGGLIELSDGFDLNWLIDRFADEGVTHFVGPVAHLNHIKSNLDRFKRRDQDLYFVIGGSGFNPLSLQSTIEHLSGILINHYGCKEAGTIAIDFGSGLKPVCDLKIVENEIWIKTDSMMDGYVGLKKPFEEEGWLNTHDTGLVDDQGVLHLLGRKSDWINREGEKISPLWLEAKINRVLSLDNFCITSAHIHQKTLIVLASTQNIDLSSLRDALIKEMDAYLMPSHLFVMAVLPVTSEGKLDRKAIQMQAQKFFEENENTQVKFRTNDQLVTMIQEVLVCETLDLNQSFIGLGGDSLKAAELNAYVQDVFGTSIAPSLLLSHVKLKDWIHDFKQSQSKVLVKLNEVENEKTPLFLVHDMSGDVQTYHRMAQRFEDRAVYGLRLHPDLLTMDKFTLEQLSDVYLQSIRVITQGPIYLAGLSIGGLVAYAMAMREERVCYLGMFDTKAKIDRKKQRGKKEYLALLIKNARYELSNADFQKRLELLKDKAIPTLRHVFQKILFKRSDSVHDRVLEHFKQAQRHYQVNPYSGALDYFVALDEKDEASYAYWSSKALKTHRYEARCMHSGFVKGQYVEQTVQWMKQRFNEMEVTSCGR